MRFMTPGQRVIWGHPATIWLAISLQSALEPHHAANAMSYTHVLYVAWLQCTFTSWTVYVYNRQAIGSTPRPGLTGSSSSALAPIPEYICTCQRGCFLILSNDWSHNCVEERVCLSGAPCVIIPTHKGWFQAGTHHTLLKCYLSLCWLHWITN